MAAVSKVGSVVTMNINESFQNSDNESWTILDILDIFLNSKQETKSSLYGYIDGENDFRAFVNKIISQGLLIEDVPCKPKVVKLLKIKGNEFEDENKPNLMFEFRVNAEHKISYGSPFILEDEKTLILSFKEDEGDNDVSSDKKNMNKDNIVKIHLKVIKLFENYKILRDNAKAKDKKQIILLVEDALKSSNPPAFKMRYVIGVPNFKKLNHFERKKPKRVYKKKADNPAPLIMKSEKKTGKRSAKKITNENNKKERSAPSPKKRKQSDSPLLSKHWSDTTEMIIPNNMECSSTSGVNYEDQRSSILLQAVNSILDPLNNNIPISTTETSLVSSTTNGNVDNINLSESHSDIQNLMDAAACLLSASDMDLHTQTNVELHTVPSLDMHTGPSVELCSEPSLLSPIRNSSFNVTSMSPALNMELNTQFTGIAITPTASPKKEKKLKKKKPKDREKVETSEAEERLESQERPRPPDFRRQRDRPKVHAKIGKDRVMELPAKPLHLKDKPQLKEKRRESRESSPPRRVQLKIAPVIVQKSARIYKPPDSKINNGEVSISLRPIRNPQPTLTESTENMIVVKPKKKQGNRLSYSLEDIVRAQDKVRNKLNQIHHMSFKCGDVKRLVEITKQLEEITQILASSIPDDET